MTELTADQVLRLRLAHQHLTATCFETPGQLVQHFGAMQAQDFGAARWAVGQRLRGATDACVERAFADGEILRTHVLRPTWHFVVPEDIRWLLALTAPRVKAAARSYQSALGLDEALLAKANDVFARALEGGKNLTRAELGQAVEQAGIKQLNNLTLGHMLMNAELDAIICSGPRRGKQPTYALLDERVPATRTLERDAALAELTRRYFASHGPATLNDFAWWSGLTVADAKRGIGLDEPSALEELTVEGQSNWSAPSAHHAAAPDDRTHLLPNFDEYTVAYTPKGRALLCDVRRLPTAMRAAPTPVPLTNVVVHRGRAVGVWQRAVDKEQLSLAVIWLEGNPRAPDLEAATAEYASFLGVKVASRAQSVTI